MSATLGVLLVIENDVPHSLGFVRPPSSGVAGLTASDLLGAEVFFFLAKCRGVFSKKIF